MKISYAITASTEKEELKYLIPFLIENKDVEDEIVILFDAKNGDQELSKYLLDFNLLPNVQTWLGFDFNNDFASWKNKLNSYCCGDYILQLDGDEKITKFLIKNLKVIIESNPTVDIFLLPRINVVYGITSDDLSTWGWTMNDSGYINWPDFQTRLYRRNLNWSGKVHERIMDNGVVSAFPEEERFAIIHNKSIDKQKKQNNLYTNILTNKVQSPLTLSKIYEKYSDNTDSGSGDKGTSHSYIEIYEDLLSKYRKNSTVLEIGVSHGMSIRMWNEYFIDSKIYGVDICKNFYVGNVLQDVLGSAKKLMSEGFNIFIDDATKQEFVDKIKHLKFDVIVDDGSHVLSDQILSFVLLKNLMKEGGVYIIEDVNNIDITKSVFKGLHSNCEIIDKRSLKNRYDDVLVIYRF
jgi:hypothetical protein